mmetsp:Transcript_6596/g.9644  ORF Transcript_6596/g.9644 Transcript_6596/m.9644 type:complete len:101 (+) Transcript_6596:900-1202(+)
MTVSLVKIPLGDGLTADNTVPKKPPGLLAPSVTASQNTSMFNVFGNEKVSVFRCMVLGHSSGSTSRTEELATVRVDNERGRYFGFCWSRAADHHGCIDAF